MAEPSSSGGGDAQLQDTAQQDQALAEEAAMREQMETLFSTRKPRDAFDGLGKGAANIFKVSQSVGQPVYAPSAKHAYFYTYFYTCIQPSTQRPPQLMKSGLLSAIHCRASPGAQHC